MVVEMYGDYFVQTKEKSTSKIVGAINEVLRVRMSHNKTQVNKLIMTHLSSNCKLLHLNSVTDVLFLCLFLQRNSTKCKLTL